MSPIKAKPIKALGGYHKKSPAENLGSARWRQESHCRTESSRTGRDQDDASAGPLRRTSLQGRPDDVLEKWLSSAVHCQDAQDVAVSAYSQNHTRQEQRPVSLRPCVR